VIRIELMPDLSHCIETVAKREYWASVEKYLKGERNLEEKIELLKQFLETADFRQLRRESEKHLIEGKGVKFLLYSEEGELRYEMKILEKEGKG